MMYNRKQVTTSTTQAIIGHKNLTLNLICVVILAQMLKNLNVNKINSVMSCGNKLVKLVLLCITIEASATVFKFRHQGRYVARLHEYKPPC